MISDPVLNNKIQTLYVIKSEFGLPGRIFPDIDYSSLSLESKCEIALLLYSGSCKHIGTIASNGDIEYFIQCVANEIATLAPGSDRRVNHITFALNSIATSSPISSEAVLASAYLIPQLEYAFRCLSDHLDWKGKWKSISHKLDAEKRLAKKFKKNINNIADAYKILMLNSTLPLVKYFSEIDRVTPHLKLPDGTELSDIGERVKYVRDPAGHGPWSDTSSESRFYALLICLIGISSNLYK